MDVQKKDPNAQPNQMQTKAKNQKANKNKAQMVCLRRPPQAQKETKN